MALIPQKTSSKRTFGLVGIIILLFGVVFLVMNKDKIGREGEEPITPIINRPLEKVSLIKEFGEELFYSPQFIDLEGRHSRELTLQVESEAYDADLPLSPSEVKVFNPGLGEKLYLAWTNPEEKDFKYIRIYRSQISGQKGELVADKLEGVESYEDKNLENGQAYYYTFKSVNSQENESDNQEQYMGLPTDVTPPSLPTNVKVSGTGESGKVKIAWTNPEEKDFKYIRIYRSQISGQKGELVADKLEGVESYEDQGLKNHQNYYYLITALDTSGNESPVSIYNLTSGKSNPFQPFEGLFKEEAEE